MRLLGICCFVFTHQASSLLVYGLISAEFFKEGCDIGIPTKYDIAVSNRVNCVIMLCPRYRQKKNQCTFYLRVVLELEKHSLLNLYKSHSTDTTIHT